MSEKIVDSETSLQDLEEQLKNMSVPIELFKTLLDCAKTGDYSIIQDPIIKSRFLDSYQKVYAHLQATVYQEVYNGTTYNNFIGVIAKLFAILDALIGGRLNITDLSRQDIDIVRLFLESYGFTIHPAFEAEINKEIASSIYYYLRRKGTPQIIAALLNHMGFTHFRIDEYVLNRKDENWYLVPNPVHISQAAKDWDFTVDDIPVSSLNDPLWWLDENQLNSMFFPDE